MYGLGSLHQNAFLLPLTRLAFQQAATRTIMDVYTSLVTEPSSFEQTHHLLCRSHRLRAFLLQ